MVYCQYMKQRIAQLSDRTSNFVEEFKSFALKGNVLDLAIGVVVGTAFNKIVDSLVSDIIMPLIALSFGQPDFSAIIVAGSVRVGMFINSVVGFLIVTLSVFVAIKFITRWMPKRDDCQPGC